MAENSFDVGKVLRKPAFNIPVVLTDRDDEGAEIERQILIQYQFDDELEEKIGAGMVDDKATEKAQEDAIALAGDNKLPETKPVMRSFTISEQLALIVKSIRGVTEPLDVTYWRGVPSKHKQSIIAAINADVNPSQEKAKPSTA